MLTTRERVIQSFHTRMDTEDKSYWVQKGREEEDKFCAEIAPLYDLTVMINPNKEDDPYDHDLMVLKDNKYHPAELKSVKTPFFKASEIAGIPPTKCVTFNHKDYIRYMAKYFYRKLYIFFWVNWEDSKRGNIKVNRVDGLWVGSPPVQETPPELIQCDVLPDYIPKCIVSHLFQSVDLLSFHISRHEQVVLN